MNIVVCCKLAPDAADIEVNKDGSISLERAEWRIGSFDLHAVEAGARLAAGGGNLLALCAGPTRISQSKLKKDLLSRGPDELYLVVDDALAYADTAATSAVLAQAIRKLAPVDLVLFGEGSADLYFQQVGLQLGERLGWPSLNAISRIAPSTDTLAVERSLEDEVELLEVSLPAVLSVSTGINQPRLPTMKMILAAAKKPVIIWSLADLDERRAKSVQVLSVSAPRKAQRKRVLLAGTPEEAAQALVRHLSKAGAV